MARTPSNMIPLGTKAPTFRLPDAISGKMLSLEELASPKGTVVLFICNHCPFVKHLAVKLAEFGAEYQSRGLSIIAISSNDIEKHPDDSPEQMKVVAKENGYTFPYLYDKEQDVARAYDAACTPDIYLFDGTLRLVYRGQFDDSRPDNGLPVTGRDLRAACDALLEGLPVSSDQKPSLGCNIKWRS